MWLARWWACQQDQGQALGLQCAAGKAAHLSQLVQRCRSAQHGCAQVPIRLAQRLCLAQTAQGDRMLGQHVCEEGQPASRHKLGAAGR